MGGEEEEPFFPSSPFDWSLNIGFSIVEKCPPNLENDRPALHTH
jgi:hypothetical protein